MLKPAGHYLGGVLCVIRILAYYAALPRLRREFDSPIAHQEEQFPTADIYNIFMTKHLYYILAWFFYHIGDKTWMLMQFSTRFYILNRLLERRLWGVYQKSMSLSVEYDERAGFKIWKLPHET